MTNKRTNGRTVLSLESLSRLKTLLAHSSCFRIRVTEGWVQNNSNVLVASYWTFSTKLWSNSKSDWCHYDHFAQFYLSANILFTFGKKIQDFAKHFFTTRNPKYKIRRVWRSISRYTVGFWCKFSFSVKLYHNSGVL